MICRLADLRSKEVINIKDGVRLGCVCDAELDTCTAKLISIVVYGRPRFFGILGREEDIVIKWCDIEVIGEETILVSCCLPSSPQRRGFFRNLWGG